MNKFKGRNIPEGATHYREGQLLKFYKLDCTELPNGYVQWSPTLGRWCTVISFDKWDYLTPLPKVLQEDPLVALGKSLFGKKMRVTPETSKLVQAAVFAAGGYWSNRIRETSFTESTCLYIDCDGHLFHGLCEDTFKKDEAIEVIVEAVSTLVVKAPEKPVETEEQKAYTLALVKLEEAQKALEEARKAVELNKPKEV